MEMGLALGAALMIYGLMGAWFGRVWGVDPSRRTPRTERDCRRKGGGWTLLPGFALVCVWPQMALGASLMRAYGERGMLAALALLLVLGGLLSMSALFVSVRRGGKSMSQVAGEEFGVWARKGMDAVCAVMLLLCAAAMCGMLKLLMSGYTLLSLPAPEYTAASMIVLLTGLYAAAPALWLSGRIRNERQVCRVGLGGVLLGCVIAGAAPAAIAALDGFLDAQAEKALCAALCGVAALACAALACGALGDLLRRQTLYSKKNAWIRWAAPLLTVALTAALAQMEYFHILRFAGALGFFYAMLSLIVCAVWLNGVGRGLLHKGR